MLPQLLLLRQTTVPTVVDSFYLVTLGSYRAFYILNWILRAATDHFFEPIAVIFGIVQTAFYVDFAWVYWTRQRVKLRNGGVVDSEDLSRGWLVSRVLGKGHEDVDEEIANAHGQPQNGTTKPARSGWGARGVSISADDQLTDSEWNRNPISNPRTNIDQLRQIAEEGADDESGDIPRSKGGQSGGINNKTSDGSEWRNENS